MATTNNIPDGTEVVSGGRVWTINGSDPNTVTATLERPMPDIALPKIDSTSKAILVRAYLDGLFRYAFFLEDRKNVVSDDGGRLVRFTGNGMEVVTQSMIVRPYDDPEVPSQQKTWVYGSNDNLVANPNLTEGDVPANPDGSEGNDEEGNADGWSTRGTVDSYESITDLSEGYENRDTYIQVDPGAHHSGIEQSFDCTPNQIYHIRAYLREPTGGGYRYTLAVGGANDIAATGTYANNFEFGNEILAELDNVARNPAGNGCPGGASDGTWQVMDVEVQAGAEQTSMTFAIQADTHPACSGYAAHLTVPFDVGLVEVEGWGVNLDQWDVFGTFNLSSNPPGWTRTSDVTYAGQPYSMQINPTQEFAGTEQLLQVSGNAKYTGTVFAYVGTAQAGDEIRLEFIDPDTKSIFIQTDTTLVSSSWVQASVVYTMPANQEQAIFRIVYSGPNNPNPIYLSNFAVVPGEPASTWGKILTDLITPIQARGSVAYMTLDFNESVDSAGQSWHSLVSIDINPGSSIYDVLRRGVSLGYEWRVAPSGYADDGGSSGFLLEVWNSRNIDSNSGMGAPLLGDEDPVVYLGEGVTTGESMRQTRRPNVVYVEGANGQWTEVFQQGYVNYENTYGRVEDYISVSDVSDQSTLSQFGEAYLIDERDREIGTRLKFTRTAGLRPYQNFRVGDSIFIDAPPNLEDPDRANPRRVRSIQVTCEGEGSDVNYNVDFGRVTYKDDAAILSVIAQLQERSPTDSSGVGSGSVVSSGSQSSVVIQGGTVGVHTHDVEDLTKRTVTGDVSGQLTGPLSVNKIKGIPVDSTINTDANAPADDDASVMVYDQDGTNLRIQRLATPTLADVSVTRPATNELLKWTAEVTYTDVSASALTPSTDITAATQFPSSSTPDKAWQAEVGFYESANGRADWGASNWWKCDFTNPISFGGVRGNFNEVLNWAVEISDDDTNWERIYTHWGSYPDTSGDDLLFTWAEFYPLDQMPTARYWRIQFGDIANRGGGNTNNTLDDVYWLEVATHTLEYLPTGFAVGALTGVDTTGSIAGHVLLNEQLDTENLFGLAYNDNYLSEHTAALSSGGADPNQAWKAYRDRNAEHWNSGTFSTEVYWGINLPDRQRVDTISFVNDPDSETEYATEVYIDVARELDNAFTTNEDNSALVWTEVAGPYTLVGGATTYNLRTNYVGAERAWRLRFTAISAAGEVEIDNVYLYQDNWTSQPKQNVGAGSQVFQQTVLAAGAGVSRLYNNSGTNRTVTGITVAVGVAPSGGTVTGNVVRDGTTDLLTSGWTIADGTNVTEYTTIDSATWNDGSYLTVDVDSFTTPAASLTVEVYWEANTA